VILSAGLLTLTSGHSSGQPKVPADPGLVLGENKISRFSTKYLLRAANKTGISALFMQHRSHSSHSSHSSHYSSSSPGHASHASHASHYSSSYPTPAPAPSHSSHYSASGPTPSSTPRNSSTPRTLESTPLPKRNSAFGFNDNFDRSLRTTKWILGALNADQSSLDTEVTVEEKSNRLQITPRPNITGRHFNGYLSVGEWDLTDAKASIEVIQVAGDKADTVFAIGIDSDNWYGFVEEDGTLYMQSKVKGQKLPKSLPYNPTMQRFWRFHLSATDNTVSWETSPDGRNWKVERQELLQIDIASAHITLSAGTYQISKTTDSAIFDNFRLEH
jgi:hypothetical protein